VRPERVDEGDIGRVTAARNHDPADTGRIVARIKRVPSTVQEDLDPPLKSIGSTTGTPMSPR
jgi:hypothetical protein